MFDYDNARRDAEARFAAGWRPQKLLGSENYKLKKSAKMNIKGFGLSLAPADVSGYEVCASRSPECTKHCIFSAGKGFLPQVQMGRIFRTIWYFQDRAGFIDRLMSEIQRNQEAVYRLNVFSDIQWERQFPEIFSDFPRTQFYDYTKHFKRMGRERPDNYHLTFSLNEKNEQHARDVLQAGMNVAAVTDSIGGTLFGYRVIDGDDHDLRYLDPSPVVVGLRPKGSLRKAEDKGFVYATTEWSQAA